MKFVQYPLLTLMFFAASLYSQTDRELRSIYLIGNTGLDTIPSEAIQLLAFECFDDTNGVVVLLGDNVLPDGIKTGKGSRVYESERKLISQFEMFVGFTGYFYLIPGHTDWAAGRGSGLRAVKRQEQLSNDWFRPSTVKNRETGVFMPGGALPGPSHIDLPEGIRLIFIDTEWLLHRGIFKFKEDYKGFNHKLTKELFYKKLDSLVQSGQAEGKVNIVLGHHPVYSNGRHIHVIEPLRSLINYTPLQVLGLLGLNRLLRQDLVHPPYRRMRKRLHSIFSQNPGLIYVSAHEHGQEAFEKDSVFYLVSGAGAYPRTLDRYRFPAFFMDDLQSGFLKLSFYDSGAIYLHAFGVSDRGEFWKKKLREK